jgi:hypothetical protein
MLRCSEAKRRAKTVGRGKGKKGKKGKRKTKNAAPNAAAANNTFPRACLSRARAAVG